MESFLLVESPEDPELHELMGRCHVEMGRYKEAVKEFKTAIKLAPSQVNVYPRLADVLRYKYATLKTIEEADQLLGRKKTAKKVVKKTGKKTRK